MCVGLVEGRNEEGEQTNQVVHFAFFFVIFSNFCQIFSFYCMDCVCVLGETISCKHKTAPKRIKLIVL